jgi:hypothetical protein
VGAQRVRRASWPERIARLKRGEDIAAGLDGRRFGPTKAKAILREIAVTEAGISHLQDVAAMSEQTYEK